MHDRAKAPKKCRDVAYGESEWKLLLPANQSLLQSGEPYDGSKGVLQKKLILYSIGVKHCISWPARLQCKTVATRLNSSQRSTCWKPQKDSNAIVQALQQPKTCLRWQE